MKNIRKYENFVMLFFPLHLHLYESANIQHKKYVVMVMHKQTHTHTHTRIEKHTDSFGSGKHINRKICLCFTHSIYIMK